MTARAALRRAALAGGAWLAAAGASGGQTLGGVERNTREGAEHFENGRLEEALRAFSRARDAWPEAPENDLNLAGVHYRMGEAAPPGGAAAPGEEAGAGPSAGPSASPFAEAARGYIAALEGPAADRLSGPARRDAFFNLGNTLFRSGAFGDAAAAYGEALALDPEDREARQNLERALLRAEEQQQEEQPQQSGEDGEPPEAENEQQQQPQQQQQERSSSGSGEEGSGEEPPPGESEPEPPEEEGDDPESGEPEPEPAAPDDAAPEQDPSGADAADPSAAQVPEITPEQAERILAALAEVERRFQEDRLEKRRARALRRGRH